MRTSYTDHNANEFFKAIDHQFKIGNTIHEGWIVGVKIIDFKVGLIEVYAEFDGDVTAVPFQYHDDEFMFTRLIQMKHFGRYE